MAVVSIDLDAMAALIRDLRNASVDSLGAALDLKNKASQAGVSAAELSLWTGGLDAHELDEVTTWCVRALALAQLVAAADVHFAPGVRVSIDDSGISSLTRGQAESLGRGLAGKLTNGQMSDTDWDTLVRNQADPYFTAALMNACPPAALAGAAQGLSQTYQQDGDQITFTQRLSTLGAALGTASRSGLLASGYADMIIDVLTQPGSPSAALSAVLSYAACDPGFAQTIATQVYDYETEKGYGGWPVSTGDVLFTMPDGSQRVDVMPGVMGMLGRCPQAAQDFFTADPGRMEHLAIDRGWPSVGSDGGDGLGKALEAACTLYETGPRGVTSDQLASRLIQLIQDKEYALVGWHVSTGMRDSVSTIMGHHLAGTTMLNNDTTTNQAWHGLPDDFIDIRCLVEDYVLDAIKHAADAQGVHLTLDQQWQSINYIAYMLARADEPYKSLYLGDISQLTIRHSLEYKITPWADTDRYFDPVNDLAVNFYADYTNPRGAFFTFFHEAGHGIDDVEAPFTDETRIYERDGQTLKDATTSDVRDNLTTNIARYTTDPAQQQRVVDALMNHTTAQLSADDTNALNQLKGYYSSTQVFASPQANVASDIYGAVTDNIIGGPTPTTYGHSSDYWSGGNYHQASEFWAGYAANNVVGGSGKTITETYLPNATALANQMANDMKE